MIPVDHIFVFSDKQGAEADALVELGLVEGEGRIHVGQGTTNRKFHFENFFLEILWVHDEDELKNGPAAHTGLWERSKFRATGCSPFGLCLVNTEETDALFSNAMPYQPDYFPKGMHIDILPEDKPYLPWTFRLPFRDADRKVVGPINHAEKFRELTKVSFGLPIFEEENRLIHFLRKEKCQVFQAMGEPHLNLVFDDGRNGEKQCFEPLGLTIEY